eukprot:TRINITY_DN2613_c0_g1_i1.p1 TRINITY_DN2613_c0_g1~~TRINITY_DN2613_c0_g1_i1.p1  ORF type:complete len:651 (+),score=187.95 TRINITY_DN2613_c0_g1_i1:40-1992(+)
MKRSGIGGANSKLPVKRTSAASRPTPSHGSRPTPSHGKGPTPSHGNRRSRSMSKGVARASSGARTPLSVRSLSVNRTADKSKDPLTPRRFQNTAKKSNFGVDSSARRISTMGPARGWKETRPLTEKPYQKEQIRKLLDFLRSKRYRNENMTSKHFPLSSKDFVEVFNFLYSFLNPQKPDILPNTKFEEKAIHVLKNELNYPGQLNRTHLITMGTMHSWPTILGCLLYIFEMVKRRIFYEENAIAIAFPNSDERGFYIDREPKNKINFDHWAKSYRIWFNGVDEDNFPDSLRHEYRDKLLEYYEVNEEQLAVLRKQREREDKQLAEAMHWKTKADSTQQAVQDNRKRVLELENRLKRGYNRKIKFDDMLSSIQDINHENAIKLKNLVEEAPFSLPSTEVALQKMAEDKVNEYEKLVKALEGAKKNKADAEAETYHREHEIQTAIRRINRFCVRQEWNINLPIPELKNGVLIVSSDLLHAVERFQHHWQSSHSEIKDLQVKIEERNGNLVRLQSKLDSTNLGLSKLQEKERTIREQIQEEEINLNGKVKELKDKIVYMSTENQRAEEDLRLEVEKLRDELQEYINFRDNRRKEIQVFQEKAVMKVQQTISVVLNIRDDAEKAVEARNLRYLTARQEALAELDKIRQEVNDNY